MKKTTMKEVSSMKETVSIADLALDYETLMPCFIKCADSDCSEWSAKSDWSPVDVRCDDCGSHLGMECPKCSTQFDHVYHMELEVRKAR